MVDRNHRACNHTMTTTNFTISDDKISTLSTIDNNKLLISTVLYKRSRHTRQWKKKWVVLRKCQLSYYKTQGIQTIESLSWRGFIVI